jgi:hypothetical protein
LYNSPRNLLENSAKNGLYRQTLLIKDDILYAKIRKKKKNCTKSKTSKKEKILTKNRRERRSQICRTDRKGPKNQRKEQREAKASQRKTTRQTNLPPVSFTTL